MNKKILIGAVVVGLTALATANKTDPKKAEQTRALASMYDQVLQKNASEAVQACESLHSVLNQTTTGKRSDALNQSFKNLVQHWKKVEATYILGDLDNESSDLPRFIDIFHIGNEDIKQQMQKILRSTQKPEVALFKHSYKTINALEAVLYSDDQLNEREIQSAQFISQNICQQLSKIDEGYQKQRNKFLQDSDHSLSSIVNVLANQTFLLKDWRIGDVAGLSKRYEGKPDLKRAEFELSGLTIPAIEAILATQAQIVKPQSYANMVEIAKIYDASKTLDENQACLTQAQQQLADLPQDFNPEQTRAFYQTVGNLQMGYYNNLIHALPVVATILEADGD